MACRASRRDNRPHARRRTSQASGGRHKKGRVTARPFLCCYDARCPNSPHENLQEDGGLHIRGRWRERGQQIGRI